MNPEIKQRIEQIRRGEVPEGYKKAKQCICPADWETTSLRELADIGQGYTFKREYQGNHIGHWNYFKVADIGLQSSSIYLSSSINKIDDFLLKQLGYKPFHAGSIVFPRVGAALLNNNKKILLHDSLVDDNVLVLSIKNKAVCSNIFLYYLLSKFQLADWCNSGLVPVINSKTVLKQSIHLPEFTEQQKISAILSTQDKAIGLKEKRLAEKQRQKKYLMQQLLTGKKRIPGFRNEWREVRLYEILTPGSKAPVSNTKNHQRITIKLNFKGIEYANVSREMADTRPFYVRKSNEIIIGKQNYFNGSIALVSDQFDGCICSNAIMSFSVHGANTYYVLKYLSQDDFLRQHQMLANGTGQKELSEKDFLQFIIKLPPIDEQAAIAKVLSTADRENDLLRQDIEQEKQKKKALMQLLLTGIVRVTPCH